MILVVLSYPNGQRKEALLRGVPRVGEHVLLSNGPETMPLVVEFVTWIEGAGSPPEPTVMVTVRPYIEGPRT